jgi:exopolyphosphatase/pppGpp-phosphohydrolase
MPTQNTHFNSSSGSEAMAAQYRRIRSQASYTGRIAVLQLGADETGVAVGAGVGPDATIILGIGSQRIANDYFKHSPPTPGELEAAIDTVEDEVTRVQGILGGGAELFTTDASVREVALAAGQTTGSTMVVSVDQVERTFGRLAAVSLGRPAALEGLPPDREFAATLLIVREFMHHLGFSQVTILT